jgi:peptide/nickel transport system permease protein
MDERKKAHEMPDPEAGSKPAADVGGLSTSDVGGLPTGDVGETPMTEHDAGSGRSGRGAFLRYILRRLGLSLLLIWGAGTILFLVTQGIPGDPVSVMLGDEAALERYGLDDPLHEQYINYWVNLSRGDFGLSLRTRGTVSAELARSLPATLELGILAGIMSLTAGVSLGVIAALRRDKILDHVIRFVTLAGISMPIFWVAMIALYLLHFRLGLFPTIGRLSPGTPRPDTITGMFTVDAALQGMWPTFWDALSHLLLPALVLAAYTTTLLTRFTRSAVLEVLNEDYIRTANAKGLKHGYVVVRHVLRAATVPIITVAGLMFTSVLSGTVLIEAIFGYPGLGNLIYQSAYFLDVPSIVGVGMVIAILYVSINFIIDLLYGAVDPRIRLGA